MVLPLEQVLYASFSTSNAVRTVKLLNRLLPYLEPQKFALVGGLAIRFHVYQAGLAYPRREFNDLDLVITDLKYLSPLMTKEILVYHFHEQAPLFYLALVDPVTKIKIDIFAQNSKEKFISVKFGTGKLQIRLVEEQLVKKVEDVGRIASGIAVDPKEIFDMRLLFKIADKTRAEVIWGTKHKELQLVETIHVYERYAGLHPELVKAHPHRQREQYICAECEVTADFPLADKRKIKDILGDLE